MTNFEDVGAFNERFGLPRYTVRDDPRMAGKNFPHILDDDTLAFKVRHLVEELQEFRDACAAKDVAGAADALVDLVYVALGTAHFMGIPFDECWAEVQKKNMTKVRAAGAADPRGKRHNAFDIVKPEGFVPPDLRKILGCT